MASSGYCGGDPERVMGMGADIVMAALQYEIFKSDYEKAYAALNSASGARK